MTPERREQLSNDLMDLRYWESTSAATPGGPTPHEQILSLVDALAAEEREETERLWSRLRAVLSLVQNWQGDNLPSFRAALIRALSAIPAG